MSKLRFFIVDPRGSAMAVDIPDDVAAGLDLLHADGMADDKAAELLWAANRSGRDAAGFAAHLVELRKAFRP